MTPPQDKGDIAVATETTQPLKQTEGGGGGGNVGSGARQRLRKRIDRWQTIRDQIEQLLDKDSLSAVEQTLLADLRDTRADIVDSIQRIVEMNPKLRDNAIKMGFRADLLTPEQTTPGTSAEERTEEQKGIPAAKTSTPGPGAGQGGGQGGGGGGGGGGGDPGPSQPLPGIRGDDYVLRRRKDGAIIAVYKDRFGDNTLVSGIKLTQKAIRALGVNPRDVKTLLGTEAKQLEILGWSDEFRFKHGEKRPWKAIIREVRRRYKGTAILDNDEVLGITLGYLAGAYSRSAMEGMLKETKWYSETTKWQRHWQLDLRAGDRRQLVNEIQEKVRDTLETIYGFNWRKHLTPEQVRQAARAIASGEFGEPTAGLSLWASDQEDIAREIEGTNAWMAAQQAEEARRRYLNAPEDKFEELRAQAIQYLGESSGGTPLIDRNILKRWANDLVTQKKSQGDWEAFLRQQMNSLHPYFDPNIPFTDQASPYMSVAKSIIGTDLSWDDPLMMKIAGTDDQGKPTGQPMALYDFAQWVRDNDPRFWSNPDTEEKGRAFAQDVLSIMGGI